ncbi:amino acid adenylation domain-containing protein [Streptomyces sp. NPDC049627]|uniref:amino acid adenylation domain-containing protein n=1 Tax=Streptomyces sp. NPDC049627 TaxID=3365595 RepID=UPI0037ADED5F
MRRYVHEVIEGQAAATPDAVAVQVGGHTVTYRELDERANQIAHRLREAGVGPESVVGVLLRRGPDTLPALLGIWKAGGSHLPLDTALPAERLRYMRQTAGARLTVTHGVSAALLGSEYRGETIDLDAERERIAACPVTPPDRSADRDPDDPARTHRLAYTLFTSGSTGRPKGVQIGQYALLNMLFSMRQWHRSGPEHRWLAITSLAFDVSTAELYLPLVTGGRVVLADDDEVRDPAAQLRLVESAGITHVQATPAGWKLLLAAGMERLPVAAVTTGEECPPGLAGQLVGRVDRLSNLYGPTEATVWCTGTDLAEDAESVPIGRPLPNYRAYVLDSEQRPVPVGVTGELYVAGAGMARGYVGRPGLTAERFLPEPYGGPPGSRMYRTGDLARFRADGQLECLGRIDNQVKIRGFRIELGEIEEVLRGGPDVHDAAVVARDDDQGEKWLVAYVVGADGVEPDPAALRDRLAATLPSYMVPAAVVPLPALPLNPAGKVDRAALPVPGRAALAGDRAYVAPRTATERQLVEICAEVLGVTDVGVRDRLQDLGADSMRIVHVMAAARRAGLGLTLRMLLDSETVEDLAQALDGTPPEGTGTEEKREGEESAMTSVAPAGGPADPTRTMAAHRVPGAAVALLRDGRLVGVQAYGVRSAESGLPVTLRTRFQAGSISKQVTAFAALRLVARGELGLDTDLDRYLSGRRAPRTATGASVTLRHLLSNTAGFSSAAATWWRPGEPMPKLDTVLDEVSAEHEPGTRFRKAGSQWALAERLLTDVTGQDFADLAADLVFTPLGMADSSFTPPAEGLAARDDWAAGHDQHGRPLLDGFRVRPVRAGSGLWSTAADIAQLAAEIRQAHLGCSELLPASLATQMLTEAFPGSFYGLGTVVDSSLGEPEFGHGGQTAGFRALVSLRLRSGSGCVVLTNGDGGKHVHKTVAASLGRELTVDDD